MTVTNSEMPKQSLGLLALIGEAFSVFRQRFLIFFGVSVIILAISAAINYLIVGDAAFVATSDITNQSPFALISGLINMLSYGFMVAVLTLAAYDVKTRKSVRIAHYFKVAAKNIIPLSVLTIVVSIVCIIPIIAGGIVGVAMPVALIVTVPLGFLMTIFLFSMFSVVNPAIVVEGAGFSSLRRSAQLTKNYRWPIIGLFAILGILLIVVLAVIGVLAGLVLLGEDFVVTGVGFVLQAQLLNIVLSALGGSYIAILIAMLYARLKELKEGIGYEDLSSVFE